jgi:hypothetical protein
MFSKVDSGAGVIWMNRIGDIDLAIGYSAEVTGNGIINSDL